ncbi:hypothetical protein, partial [Proteus columbae]|uniref:hypothetical protein n=1 Tax=Proteus columbae TaxID=1987580 RepID=UPI00200B7BD7
ILPNFYDIYRSGRIEPNELISQLINYGNKLKNGELNDREQSHKNIIETMLGNIKANLLKSSNSLTKDLVNKISLISNK